MNLTSPEVTPAVIQNSTFDRTSYIISRGFDYLSKNFLYLIIPLIILITHIVLTKKKWDKLTISFKILNILASLSLMGSLIITVKDYFLDPISAYFGLWLLILPISTMIVIGWLISYIIKIIKKRN